MESGKLIFVRATNCLTVSVSLLLLFSAVCAARPVNPLFPEELEPKASLICNGTVISVEETGIKKNFSYPNISPSSHEEIVMLAKIKVLHVFKGQASAVIEFRYRVTKPKEIEVDGADHVSLQKDGRYRFFLKPDDARGGYVGVLEGNFDDNYAVEGLWPHEPDDNPYLKKEEAIKTALDYLKSKKVEAKFDWSHPHCYPPENTGAATWAIEVFNAPGTPSNSAQIIVRGDRTVDTRLKL